jgi:hypothetical protein
VCSQTLRLALRFGAVERLIVLQGRDHKPELCTVEFSILVLEHPKDLIKQTFTKKDIIYSYHRAELLEKRVKSIANFGLFMRPLSISIIRRRTMKFVGLTFGRVSLLL